MSLPLSVLLSRTLTRLTHELDAATSPRHPAVPLASWTNVLRHIDDGGVPQGELHARARVSRRAIAYRLGALQRHGLVVLEPAPSGRRGKIVRLTDEGRVALKSHRPPFEKIEKAWAKRFGEEKVAGLRSALEALVGRFELELPHHPEGYGPADPSMGPGGRDWKPQPRGDGDTVSLLPLSALLSQALTAFAIDYEAQAQQSLMYVANVLRVVDGKGVPVSDLPALSSAVTALSGLERHGFVKVQTARDGKTKAVRLTWRSKQLHEGYDDMLADVEQRWEERYGADVVRALRTSLQELAEPVDDLLPHFFVLGF
jgi:DNA-binding MarR family transcriptional regulator